MELRFICQQCNPTKSLHINRKLSLRLFSTSPSPPPSGITHLTTRRILAIHGPDAPTFLQGLTTRNILLPTTSSKSQTGFYAAFLNAQGRILHDVHIFPASWNAAYRSHLPPTLDAQHSGYLLDVDTREAEKLRRYLAKFKLRAKVAIWLPREDEWGVWSRWGEGAAEEEEGEEIASTSPVMGRRVVVPRGKEGPAALRKGRVDEVGMAGYTAQRIRNGVAEGQEEITEGAALPQESNLDALGGIDFRKGCYVGQELTIRTHHTGVVRKRIVPAWLEREGEQGKGLAEILKRRADIKPVKDGRHGRPVGKWLGGVGDVGLALCRLDEVVSHSEEDGKLVTAPDKIFEVATEDGGPPIRLRASIPDWLYSYIRKDAVSRRS